MGCNIQMFDSLMHLWYLDSGSHLNYLKNWK
jgi:hypothetical protein